MRSRITQLDLPMKRFRGSYVIVRIDHHLETHTEHVSDRVTVKRVVWDLSLTQSEVQCLNALNGDKGSVNFWQYARRRPRVVTADWQVPVYHA